MRTAPDSRFVPMNEVFNLRDLGGYRGHGGRLVRRGVLYRSDSLAAVSGPDLDTLVGLGLRTVVDLRDDAALCRDGRVPREVAPGYLNVQPRNVRYSWAEHHEDMDLSRFIADRYLDLAANGSAHFALALELLATPGSLPAVFHCEVGRDRTGVLAALVLALVGVDEETIAEDYALSAEAELRYAAWRRATRPDLPEDAPHLVATPAPAMRAFLADLSARHGGVEGYARAGGLPADLSARLRAALLEPAEGAGRAD